VAHVLTFTRSTPDTAAKVWVDDEGAVTWGEVATVVNPWDEYSLEETIVQAAHGGGESTVVAIGSALHNDALKHSLAMGIKNALRLEEAGADCNDSLVWSALAAGAIRKLGDVDLIIFGKESVDVGTDQHSYQLARRLGWTMLGYVSRIIDADFAAGKIQAERMLEQGKQTVTAALPAVISVMKGINEPRYPNFLGIRKAAKAQIPVWSAADIEVELPKAATTALRFMNPPARAVSTEIIAGADVKEKAVTLVERLFEEKVLWAFSSGSRPSRAPPCPAVGKPWGRRKLSQTASIPIRRLLSSARTVMRSPPTPGVLALNALLSAPTIAFRITAWKVTRPSSANWSKSARPQLSSPPRQIEPGSCWRAPRLIPKAVSFPM